MIQIGSLVRHVEHGLGTVIQIAGDTFYVQFPSSIHGVQLDELVLELSKADQLDGLSKESSTKAKLRMQALVIQSINDSWGVFSRSRIALYPHQLWVCNKVLQKWPARYLVADDVGMGKTVEAGLILWPLIATKRVNRILILCPAKLVNQWQLRLKQMFDIRLSIYSADLDSNKKDFWGTSSQVVASLPTLRADSNGRHDRILDADKWDMILVDEAHHLGADERKKTLSYQLLEKMIGQDKVDSLILFTGTPHKGKDYAFLSLMALLDSSVFSPRKRAQDQYPLLSEYLIRNSKELATDMKGNKLFNGIERRSRSFKYTPEEANFYEKMTEFIEVGRAYASTKDATEANQVRLVIIALQKLASSSIAAVSSALERRIATLNGVKNITEEEINELLSEDELEGYEKAMRDFHREQKTQSLVLMENEIESLKELVTLARIVKKESRINEVMQLVNTEFKNESVLFFTEYKRTQALIVGELIQQFGKDSVGFINGENILRGVQLPNGQLTDLRSDRDDVAVAFNAGRLRYLVSTEAGGEGIDLQRHCHNLIHIDLPWNPMRLHQRVGRLNRNGQPHKVIVYSLLNPETVEGHVWTLLQSKLKSIMKSLGAVMEEPEDLLNMVLGMTDPEFFNQLFSKAASNKEGVSTWVDTQLGQLGGKSIIDTVNSLVGNAQKFDLSGLSEVPKCDLPELRPFFDDALRFNKKRPEIAGRKISFGLPKEWRSKAAIKPSYENIVFSRDADPNEESICGIGHPVFDAALRQSEQFDENVMVLDRFEEDLFIFRLSDQLTSSKGYVRSMTLGVLHRNGNFSMVRDEQLLEILNTHKAVQLTESDSSSLEALKRKTREISQKASEFLNSMSGEIKHPFKSIKFEEIGWVLSSTR